MRWNLMIFTGKRPYNSGFGEGIGRAPEAFCRLRQNGVAAEPWKARPTLAADPPAEKKFSLSLVFSLWKPGFLSDDFFP